jgi:hypothetical protein
MRSARISLSLAALVAGVAAAPAHAVDAVTPAPCAGVLLEDAAGDQSMSPDGFFGTGAGATKAPDNADITNAFFNYRAGKDGKKVLTANIQVTKLDKSIPSPQYSTGGLAWYAYYTFKGESRFVRAHNQTGDEVTYGYGVIDNDTGVFTTEGETQGAFFEGANGVVQIDMPAEAGGKLGDELGAVVARVDGFSGGPDDVSGINNAFDSAPDDAGITPPEGPPYTVTECPAGAAAAAPNPQPASPAPFSSPPAPSGGGGGGGSQPGAGGSGGSTQSTPFLSFQRTFGSARRAKKGKRLRIAVTAQKPVTALKVQLRDSKSKVVARGALSRMGTKGRVFFKIRRALKAGRYTVVATAKAGGQTQRVTQAVFVSR